MVQLGNIHIGKAETVIPPSLSIMEAAMLWEFTVARYKCIEETQIYHSYAHDPDLKYFIKNALKIILEDQINELEKQMNIYKIPLPKRPAKSVNHENNPEFISDEFLFNQIFEGCQRFIDYLARIIRSTITNDALRKMYAAFLKEELAIFEKLCKYAKAKGWLEASPKYQPS